MSLKRKLIGGALWVTGSFGLGQAIRFAGHLVLARLLAPEDFGLMVFVGLALGLSSMMTDVGFHLSVIQNPGGHRQPFLQTVWTMQVVRGVALGIILILAADLVGLANPSPALPTMLRVAAAGLVLNGLVSVNRSLYAKRLERGRIAAFEIVSQFIAVSATLGLALGGLGVWALVLGGVSRAGIRAALSFSLFKGPPMRLRFDSDVAREVWSFGKWILLSSLISFAAGNADRAVLGAMLDSSTLGAYAIAFGLVEVASSLCAAFGNTLLYPAFSSLLSSKTSAVDWRKVARLRASFMLAFVSMGVCGAALGELVVGVLYDRRYEQAGWMFRILCVSMAITAIQQSQAPLLLALGRSSAMTAIRASQAAALLCILPACYALAGPFGVIWAVVLGNAVGALGLYFALRRRKAVYGRPDIAAWLGVALASVIAASGTCT